LSNNTDVYTVDKSWYDVLADIITDPPYIPAALAIDTPTVSSPAVAVGATETVSVNITNNGDVIGAFNINLLIGGNLVNTQAITLGPRASQVVTFQVVESTAGKYVASINQTHNVSFTVQ
jgi:archaellum component FlaF (FlaF/FlaG flagellin family)